MGEVLSGREAALRPLFRPLLLATFCTGLMTGCSDGGDSDTSLLAGQSNSNMSCPDSGMQCSGNSILRVDNGIGVTDSGMQTYATSTNDLMPNNPAPGSAWGLQPASGGLADIRVSRDANGQTTGVTLLLSKLGISWDGKTERPLIIETFEKRQGRVQLDSHGVATFSTLPPPTDLNFYDYGKKASLATQANYANNIYFPRSEPVRCPSSKPDCPAIETDGLHVDTGDWRNGGFTPDNVWGSRLHEDGATQAGYGQDANGQLVLLPAADGIGVSYPGFKGFRDYHQWSYAHANLASWITQDTVQIDEWSNGNGNEHNKMRRGFVAFGAVTKPSLIPASGTVHYAGSLRGWFSYQKTEDSYPIAGQVEATVDFAKRTVTVSFTGTRIDEGTMDVVPVAMTTTVSISDTNLANYANGTAANGTLSGGIGARFYGPVGAGNSGTGPAEVAGIFQMQREGGAVAIGGFLLKRM